MEGKSVKKIFVTTAAILLACSAMAHANEEVPGADGQRGFYDEALSVLPNAKSTQIRSLLKQERDKDAALFDLARQQHKELRDLMIAGPFDKEAYVVKSKEIQKTQERIHGKMAEAFAQALSGLTQEERMSLSDALHRKHKQHRTAYTAPDDDAPAAH
jgi:Spy/CpxP family protein refolding chaperone